MTSLRVGMVGLGRMGWGMTARLREKGHEVVGYDRVGDRRDVSSLDELVERLGDPGRRVVWIMVPSGDVTEEAIVAAADRLTEGDVVVDGGNSNFRDTIRRGEDLSARGLRFVDAGVSGGVWGLKEGFCLMVGGDADVVDRLQPVFDALAPEGGFVHAGPTGAGHFTKMVHNGIEYGMMQAYAEGFELLTASPLGIDVAGAVRAWRRGSVVRSWLLDLLDLALEDDPGLDSIRGWADDSGEGRWTVQTAVDLAVPAPVISAALFARFASRQDESPAMKVVSALRNQFGGHAVRQREPVEPAPEDEPVSPPEAID